MTAPVAEASYDVTMQAIVRYAGASGDFTPIHYDPDALRAAGYDRFFAMGMLAAGHLGALVAETYGDESVRAFHTRFRQRSHVGSTVTVRLYSGAEIDADGCISIRLEAVDETDAVVVDGQGRIAVTGRH